MKKLIPFFSLCFFFSQPFQNTKAANPAGSQITYKYLGNSLYKVTYFLFRDCRGISSSAYNVGWYAGSGGNTSCGTGNLNGFTRTSIIDITPVCSSKSKPCNPQNTYGTGEGIEVHVYEDTLDLSKPPFSTVLANSSCTELAIYVDKCCRSGAITTGSAGNDFKLTTVINIGNLLKCKKQTNNSPELGIYTPMFMCCSQPVYSSLGAIDTLDYDSLSFALSPGLSGIPNSSASYSSPFTYQFPITSYCPGTGGKINCTPQPTSMPPRGFYLNPRTGDLIFTPVKCDEASIVVIEITEWRKDTLGVYQPISKTYRDVITIVKDDCGYNNPPTIIGNYTSKITEGEKFCMSFAVEDKPYTPHQSGVDSILVSWSGSDSKPKWSFTRGTTTNKGKVDFCWTPDKSDISNVPHTFTIQVSDDHCPKPALVSRTFEVLVLERDSSWMTINTALPCSGVKLEGFVNKGNPNKSQFYWEIVDTITKKVFLYNSGKTITPQYLPKSIYKANLRVVSDLYGYATISQFFTVTTDMPTVKLSKDTTVCKYNDVNLFTTSTFMTPPLNYAWRINGNLDSNYNANSYILGAVDTLKTAIVWATDKDGCVAKDTATISVFALPEVAWSQSPLSSLCANAQNPSLELLLTKPNGNEQGKGILSIRGALTHYGSSGLVDSIGNNKFILGLNKINNQSELSGGKTITETLTAWFADSNGCVNSANTSITINGYPIVELQSKSMCQNQGKLNMDSLIIRPATKFGQIQDWSLISIPSGVNPSNVLSYEAPYWFLNTGSPAEDFYSGDYVVVLKVSDQNTGCFAFDTTTVMVQQEASLKFTSLGPLCEGEDSIDLLNKATANNTKPNLAFSKFSIISRDGNTSPSNWGTATINDQYFIGKPKAGEWLLRFVYNPNGCPVDDSAYYSINPTPIVKFSTSPDSICPLTLPYFNTSNQTQFSGTGSLAYIWYFNYPDLSLNSNAFEPQISYASIDSTYKVRLTASSNAGCSSYFEKSLQVGKGKYSWLNAPSVNEHRVNQWFQLDGINQEKIDILVYNTAGKLVAIGKNNAAIVLPSGVYYYKIQITKLGHSNFINGINFVPESK